MVLPFLGVLIVFTISNFRLH